MTDLFADEDESQEDIGDFEPIPPSPQTLIGFDDIESQLFNAINASRLPHAMIFTGDEGRGKESMAMRLAGALLSANKKMPFHDLSIAPYDPIARRLAEGTHPDFRRIGRVNKESKAELANEIVIKTIREATHFLTYKPVESAWRVMIVNEADLMNEETQNAFLKSLEEPPPYTLLILIAHNLSRLLPTIRSRARIVHFPPLPDHVLREAGGAALNALPAPLQTIVLRLSHGGVGAMRRLLEPETVEALSQIIDILSCRPSAADIKAFADRWMDISLPDADPMQFLEKVLVDHILNRLNGGLEEEALRDQCLSAYDDITALGRNLRLLYLDKKQVIKQFLSFVDI